MAKWWQHFVWNIPKLNWPWTTLSSKPGVFNLLGHAPPQVCLISLAPPPFLRKIIFLLLFLINIIYIRNARIRYTDVHLIFTLLFTFTWNNRLCLRGYSSRQPLVFTCCLRRLSVCARRHAETLYHSAWVPRWDVLGLNGLKLLYCLNWQDLKHVRIKNFLEEAALAWSLR